MNDANNPARPVRKARSARKQTARKQTARKQTARKQTARKQVISTPRRRGGGDAGKGATSIQAEAMVVRTPSVVVEAQQLAIGRAPGHRRAKPPRARDADIFSHVNLKLTSHPLPGGEIVEFRATLEGLPPGVEPLCKWDIGDLELVDKVDETSPVIQVKKKQGVHDVSVAIVDFVEIEEGGK